MCGIGLLVALRLLQSKSPRCAGAELVSTLLQEWDHIEAAVKDLGVCRGTRGGASLAQRATEKWNDCRGVEEKGTGEQWA